MSAKIIELGCPGHLIVALSCRWRRHTQVGNYRVSTLGDYFPIRGEKRDTLGAGDDSLFESMVFRLTKQLEPNNDGCGCRQVHSYDGLEQIRYATAGDAQRGHERLVKKYARKK